MINHPSFPVLTSMCSGPQVCSAPAHCRSRSPSCLQATLRSLPRKPPPCLRLAVHLRGNLLLSWTRLSGGETESNSNRVLFSRGEGVFTLLPCEVQVVQNCPSSVRHTEILKSPQNSSPFLFLCLFLIPHSQFCCTTLSLPSPCQPVSASLLHTEMPKPKCHINTHLQQDLRSIPGNSPMFSPSCQKIIKPVSFIWLQPAP